MVLDRRVSGAEVVQAGGLGAYVKELIGNVRNGNMEAKEKAAATLAMLAEQMTENADQIGRQNGVPSLVALVLMGSAVAQEHAATALACIARANKDWKQAMITHGAIMPLATILRSGGGGVQEAAAAAFASISDNAEAQKAIIKTGCVPVLVELLRRSSTAQVNASQALAHLAGLNVQGQTEVHQAGAVKYLLLLLGSGKAQEHAAKALARLSSRNGTIQADICKQGGIARLLALLSGRDIDAQIQAAAALSELAQGANGLGHRKTQDAISKAGGISPLLAMVECSPVVVKAVAESVKCLAEVARRNRANQDTIAWMGGIKPLVELLNGSHHEEVQANASLAITELTRRNRDNQTAVAEIGGIGLLVTLLRSSGKASVEAEAAGALWTMSVDHDPNKVSIASQGAIETLCKLLGSNDERAQTHSANALASLALGHPDNQAQMAPVLVLLLAPTYPEGTQKRAAKALWRIVKESPDNQAHIAKSGGAAELVKLLRDGSAGAQKYSLWALSLSIDKDNQETVSESEGVKPLVHALMMDNRTVTLQATAALAALALNNKHAQLEIAKCGGIAPLISLLDRFESEGTQEHAAAALCEIACIPTNQAAIDRAGGIAPLVSLLVHDGAISAKKYAAVALARMSEGKQTDQQIKAEKEAIKMGRKPPMTKAEQIAAAGAIIPLVNLLSGLRGGDAQEAAANALCALAGDSGNRLLITESGGIGPLVLLLGCDNPKAREHAEDALVRLSIEIANREAIIKQLVSMLADAGSAAQEQAAAALANLARDSTDNRTSIVEAGGIQPLLNLLEGNSNRAKENSASAITHLCATRDNQDAIAEAGGVPLLVSVLAASSASKETSSIMLCSLAAKAVWQLAKDHESNQLLIAEAGAITPLVSMLGNAHAEMQSNAAGALATLAQNNQDNQGAIARTGAIAPLCTLVREGNAETKEQSAAALWALSADNAPNKVCHTCTCCTPRFERSFLSMSWLTHGCVRP